MQILVFMNHNLQRSNSHRMINHLSNQKIFGHSTSHLLPTFLFQYFTFIM